MEEYRIVTNGVTFKIQHLRNVGFWREKIEWCDYCAFGQHGFNITYFSSKEGAEKFIKNKNKNAAKIIPWTVV